jgi:aspartokinase
MTDNHPDDVERRMLAMFSAENSSRQIIALQSRLDSMARDMTEQEKAFEQKMDWQSREFDKKASEHIKTIEAIGERMRSLEGYAKAGRIIGVTIILPFLGFVFTLIGTYIKQLIFGGKS